MNVTTGRSSLWHFAGRQPRPWEDANQFRTRRLLRGKRFAMAPIFFELEFRNALPGSTPQACDPPGIDRLSTGREVRRGLVLCTAWASVRGSGVQFPLVRS